MKLFTFYILLLSCGFTAAEESKFKQFLRKCMNGHGWNTEGVTFRNIQKQALPIMILRSDEIVGYYYQESEWKQKNIERGILDGVTEITFGYTEREAVREDDENSSSFKISDKMEIDLWIAAYQNHTEFERQFSCFVPTSKKAGFELTRSELFGGGSCFCSLALRFYKGKEMVLELKGHLDQSPHIESRKRNMMLHQLVKAKMPLEEPVEEDNITPNKKNLDPFADE